MKTVTLIVPVYNEEETIPLFLGRVVPLLEKEPYAFELIFINDGSRDRTYDVLLAFRQMDSRIRIINLARNFGKELAMTAGFQAASGDAVIPMDVDLQDPPELIHEFLRQWEAGYDVVLGVRRERKTDTRFKRLTAGLFYHIFNMLCGKRLVPNAGDYRLMNRKALDALNSLPERVRFTKGLYAWIGFSQTTVAYDRPSRIAGKTKWNIWKLWNFALDGITSFSTLPLRIWSYLGILIALFGFGYALFLIIRALLWGVDIPGYTSLMVVTLVLGGMILISLGVIGEYLGRVFEETKNRPLYIAKDRVGFDDRQTPPPSPEG